jgi:hypothetical protein
MRKALFVVTVVSTGCVTQREACADGETFDHEGQVCRAYTEAAPFLTEVWTPAPGTTWQWQLTGEIDTSLNVDMYDVDLFETPDSVFEALSGKTVVCYFSAGSVESFRDDALRMPEEAIGDRLLGWTDERWLDVSHPAVLEMVERRLDLAVERGCDGVEPDNVDGHTNRSGFPISAAEQLQFNRFIADQAHTRSLSIGLKNDIKQLEELEPWFDWALNEECHEYEECGTYTPFRRAGKAIFHTKYVTAFSRAEAKATEVCVHPGFSTLVKLLDLGPERIACQPD